MDLRPGRGDAVREWLILATNVAVDAINWLALILMLAVDGFAASWRQRETVFAA